MFRPPLKMEEEEENEKKYPLRGLNPCFCLEKAMS